MSSKKLDAAIDALVDALGPSTSLNSGSVATRSASALPIPGYLALAQATALVRRKSA